MNERHGVVFLRLLLSMNILTIRLIYLTIYISCILSRIGYDSFHIYKCIKKYIRFQFKNVSFLSTSNLINFKWFVEKKKILSWFIFLFFMVYETRFHHVFKRKTTPSLSPKRDNLWTLRTDWREHPLWNREETRIPLSPLKTLKSKGEGMTQGFPTNGTIWSTFGLVRKREERKKRKKGNRRKSKKRERKGQKFVVVVSLVVCTC